MNSSQRNVLIVVLVFLAVLFGTTSWGFHLDSIRNKHEAETDRAFDKRCDDQDGFRIFGCTDVCVRRGSFIERKP